MKITKTDIDRLKRLKASADYYITEYHRFYDEAEEIIGNVPLFHHWFKNNINTFEEVIEDMVVEEIEVLLEKVEEHGDGTASYVFSVTDDYRTMVGLEMNIVNVTDEVVKDYLEKNLS